MNGQGLRLPTRSRQDLSARINYLAEAGHLTRAPELHSIRKRRNQLAHESDIQATWEELDKAVTPVHDELQHLALVGTRPRYKAFAERSALKKTTRPDALYERTYTFGVRRESNPVIEMSWTEWILKD